MEKKDELLRILPGRIHNYIGNNRIDYAKLQEIRMRSGKPYLIYYKNEEYFITKAGEIGKDFGQAVVATKEEIRETLGYISNYSLYAFEDEMRQGFITIQGGHRVGLAGKIVIEEEKIKAMKQVSCLNIRLAHEITGCADKVMPFIRDKMGDVFHTLIISPPKCGKTTLLRDIIRQVSDGERGFAGKQVGVVDERSEIGACYMGEPQNNLGIRTDVLDCCPKEKGMMMMIRSMSPEVIAVDEIGSQKDMEAIEYVMNCGCKLIATVHGYSLDDIKKKPVLKSMVQEKMFERYIILNGRKEVGKIEGVYDAEGKSLC